MATAAPNSRPASRPATVPNGGAALAGSGAIPRVIQSRLVLLGESAVGKSSLVLRFVKDQFPEYQEATIGAAYLTKTVVVDDDVTVKFEIWDTAGQERYHSLAPMYYRKAEAAVIVYDLTKSETFERAKSWVNELQRMGSPNVIIALVGNKSDLTVPGDPNSRGVPEQLAATYAEDHGLLHMETSAKTGLNVGEIFQAIASRLPKNKERSPGPTDTALSQTSPPKTGCDC